MTKPTQRTPVISAEQALAKGKLRQRILEIVNRKGSASDLAIWQESAPEYLPWRPMIEEIQALDQEKKLRLEIAGPGEWIIHSLDASTTGKPHRSKRSQPKGRTVTHRQRPA